MRTLKTRSKRASDTAFRTLLRRLPQPWPNQYRVAKDVLGQAMQVVALDLSARWEDDRYVRAEYAFD